MMDTRYLQRHLGSCLVECLAEVAEKRPLDPIEYISNWLYKYIENVEYKKQMAAESVKLTEEQEEYAKQAKIEEIKKAEAETIRLEEESMKEAEMAKQKRSEDLANLPGAPPANLTTVDEEEN
ncbi:unnamed protein product [Owenia fusiformis]|uniref:DPY30 domain-containing protein 1 n=1 Tax=Owenia fusiformis TaxID=6347 RepID=A0A8J1U4H2_OWEFU|nr:unnamed protein product [Owenia fusiformis]